MTRSWSWLVVLFALDALGCNQGANAGSSATAKSPDAETPDAAAVLLVAANTALALEVAAAMELDAEAAAAGAGSDIEAREPDVQYVPTPEPVVEQMLELADVREGDVVYDLGCGDGRIVIMAAERYGVRALGFDIDPARVAEARANVEAAGVEDLVTIEQRDIFDLDLSPASVVTLYLLPELNERLLPQLRALKPGARIVSHDFGIAGIEPVDERTLRVDSDLHEVYLWQTPLPTEGAAEPVDAGLAPAEPNSPEPPAPPSGLEEGRSAPGATEAPAASP